MPPGPVSVTSRARPEGPGGAARPLHLGPFALPAHEAGQGAGQVVVRGGRAAAGGAGGAGAAAGELPAGLRAPPGPRPPARGGRAPARRSGRAAFGSGRGVLGQAAPQHRQHGRGMCAVRGSGAVPCWRSTASEVGPRKGTSPSSRRTGSPQGVDVRPGVGRPAGPLRRGCTPACRAVPRGRSGRTPARRAIPKSSTFTCPSASMTFWGLRSRWTMPWAWASSRARATSSTTATAAPGAAPLPAPARLQGLPRDVLHHQEGHLGGCPGRPPAPPGARSAGRGLRLPAQALAVPGSRARPGAGP